MRIDHDTDRLIGPHGKDEAEMATALRGALDDEQEALRRRRQLIVPSLRGTWGARAGTLRGRVRSPRAAMGSQHLEQARGESEI